MVLCIVLAVFAVVLDQITKLLVVQRIAENASAEGIRGVFRLTYVKNSGAAFGMFANHRWVFLIFSVVAIVAILLYVWKTKPKSLWVRLGLGMILGGGIGNMIDRVRFGYVVDFIDLSFMRFAIFNVADSFVTVGCVLLFVWLIASTIQERRALKVPAPAEHSSPAEDDHDV